MRVATYNSKLTVSLFGLQWMTHNPLKTNDKYTLYIIYALWLVHICVLQGLGLGGGGGHYWAEIRISPGFSVADFIFRRGVGRNIFIRDITDKRGSLISYYNQRETSFGNFHLCPDEKFSIRSRNILFRFYFYFIRGILIGGICPSQLDLIHQGLMPLMPLNSVK